MMSDAFTLPTRDGLWLVYARTFTLPRRPGAVAKDVQAYFDALGYTLTATTPTLIFERGSWLMGLISPNPAAQPMRVLVDIFASTDQETLVEVRLRVNTFGSLSYRTDHDFREAELEGLSVLLAYGYLDVQRSIYAAERAQWFSVAVALAGIAVLAGALAGVALLALLA